MHRFTSNTKRPQKMKDNINTDEYNEYRYFFMIKMYIWLLCVLCFLFRCNRENI